jgi:hypothetical protein
LATPEWIGHEVSGEPVGSTVKLAGPGHNPARGLVGHGLEHLRGHERAQVNEALSVVFLDRLVGKPIGELVGEHRAVLSVGGGW